MSVRALVVQLTIVGLLAAGLVADIVWVLGGGGVITTTVTCHGHTYTLHHGGTVEC